MPSRQIADWAGGTNLLGLVKHLADIEFGYFGDTFGRPFPGKLPWDESDPNSDNR